MRLRLPSGPLLAMAIALFALAAMAQTSPNYEHTRPVDESGWLEMARTGRIEEARELLLWDSVRGETTPAAINEYLALYPNGTYAGLARLRLEALRREGPAAGAPIERAVATPGEAGPAVSPPPLASLPPGPTPATLSAAPLTSFTLPSGDAVEDYDKAFAALRAEDYEVAEGRLRSFVESHSGDVLAPNALFWLGEIYMIRREHRQAAAAFSDSLRARPDGNKAEETLLKLGMALGRDGRPSEACSTLARLRPDDPALDARLKATLFAERRRLGC